MNKAFTHSKEIVLDDNYKIIPDTDNGVILVFKTTRINKKDEVILHDELFYFTRIAQALRYYSDKIINSSESLEDCIYKSESVYNLINRLDKQFKQFN
jgi:hypothetical protein